MAELTTLEDIQLFQEYLKERELSPEGTYKINPYTFLDFFLFSYR